MKKIRYEIRKIIKKTLLKEARLLLESKKKLFKKLVDQGKLSLEDFDSMINPRNGGFSHPFNDDIFRSMLFNTLEKSENHSFQDIVAFYPMIKQKIADPFRSGAELNVSVPGTANESINLGELIKNKLATYEDFKSYVDIISSTSNRTEVLQKVLDEGFAGDTLHFEVIHEDDNWIVCYPDSYQGSIALAKMGPDKVFYASNEAKIGKMSWCTSVDGNGNMFLNYHRRLNMHMYYCTRKNGFNPRHGSRKLCLSFVKSGNHIALSDDNYATVDGDNKSLKEPDCIKLLGTALFEKIEKDVGNPDRPEIDIVSYFSSINLHQYRNMRAAANNSENDLEMFASDIESYLEYNKSEEVRREIASDPSEIVQKAFVMSTYASADEVESVLMSTNSEEVKISAIYRESNLKHRIGTNSAEGISLKTKIRLAKENNPKVLRSLAILKGEPEELYYEIYEVSKPDNLHIMEILCTNKSCPISILRELSYAKKATILSNIASNPKSTKEIILNVIKTLTDNFTTLPDSEFVLRSLFSNLHTPEEFINYHIKNGSPDLKYTISYSARKLPRETIITLLRDTDENVRYGAVNRKDLDTDVVEMFLNDPDSFIRSGLAGQPSLSQSAILKLSRDRIKTVRCAIAQNPIIGPDIQMVLAKDKTNSVKACLANNTSITLEAAKEIAKSQDKNILSKIAMNDKLPEEVADDLLLSHPGMAEIFKMNLIINHTPSSKAIDLFYESIKNNSALLNKFVGLISSCRKTPENVLLDILGSENLSEEVRSRVALNVDALTPAIYEILFSDPVEQVRLFIAKWTDGRPRSVIEYLRDNDPSAIVREEARRSLGEKSLEDSDRDLEDPPV